MNTRIKGFFAGAFSAMCYGTNPLGGLFLYEEGLTPDSVLVCRFSIAVIILAIIMLLSRRDFALNCDEFKLVTVLGILFAVSALSLYSSFLYMAAGIASTLLFSYPVIVAVIMAVLFKEKLSKVSVLSIVITFIGVAMLSGDGTDRSWDYYGAFLVLLSSLSYAVYMIVVNKSKVKISAIKLNLYMLMVCIFCILLYSLVIEHRSVSLPLTSRGWFFALWLGIVPTIFSLVTMVISIHLIGSTPTAVIGALEPLTAVLIGIFVFDEPFFTRLAIGIALILCGVVLITTSRQLSISKLSASFSAIGKKFKKHWRWRIS